MKIARVSYDDTISFAVIEGDTAARIDGSPIGAIRFTGDRFPLEHCRLLAPVLPSKIIGAGHNYREHLDGPKPQDPFVFLKPSTAVIGPGESIRKPSATNEMFHEGELAVVVAGLVRNADLVTAERSILGYTCANDVTARDLQRSDGQWARAKGFDTFCPLGPWIETDLDPSDLKLQVRVNDEVRQDTSTAELVFTPVELVSWLSHVMTLLPGDVILTGTPAGLGPLEPNDTVEVEIEGIGILRNFVEEGR